MIGVIADDLSGAAELGGVGLRCGLAAEILVAGKPNERADLVCIDTDSRFCQASEAGNRAARAAHQLAEAGARWIYKKTDSVLRGQVAAEVEAIRKALRLESALLVPANPSLGRVIRNGSYFVHGQQLDETEFARDPEHPRWSAKVTDLVQSSAASPVQVCHLGETLPACGIVIGEAETPGDLDQWAARRTSKLLVAGAAEFFGALLAEDGIRSRSEEADAGALRYTESSRRRAQGRELFVCGSTSDSAREFVAAARQRGTPVFSLLEQFTTRSGCGQSTEPGAGGAITENNLAAIVNQAIAALQSHQRIILNIGLPLMLDRTMAKRLHVYLTQVAEMVLRQVEVEQVYVEGGATAVELVRRLGWNRLAVLRELAPGSAALHPENRPGLELIIKPGTYRWPEEVWR